jgi:hypothetical protein
MIDGCRKANSAENKGTLLAAMIDGLALAIRYAAAAAASEPVAAIGTPLNRDRRRTTN